MNIPDPKEMGMAMKLLFQALTQKWKLPDKKESKTSRHLASKKNHVHIHKTSFKSRQILAISPAMYRRLHLGKTSQRGEAKNES